MGKIRVEDLARKMGIPEQDLLFKLKSIGVRLDEKDPRIDTSVIQAILTGQSLPQPREVILRDEESKASAPTPASRRRPPQRRMPPGPPRPTRRRTIIQKVEPRIKTIPTTEPPPVPGSPQPAAGDATATVAPVAPSPAEGSPETGTVEAGAPARVIEGEKDQKKERRPKKTRPKPQEEEDLRAHLGKVKTAEEVEAEEEAAKTAASSRSRRRADRKEEAAKEEAAGRVLQFKLAAPDASITISEGMTVRDFADKLGVKAKDLIQLLFQRGVMATINHVLDPELAKEVAGELGVDAAIVTFEEEIQLLRQVLEDVDTSSLVPRAPVVTIMGHVDHGKTTLLDGIRSSKITESEFGGITQHIGAYEVETKGRKIVFLDTPGHEAFTMMRARGAQVTDIVVLVVAADDGVMPQTVEAIDHARAANVPIIVAVNKIDKPDANPDRVKKELGDHDLQVEDWGGNVVALPISALKMEGIPELMEMILLSADLLELKASPDLPAQAVVLEAQKEPGRGIVATVLIQNGTLRQGDIFESGTTWGRVRSMNDDAGERIQEVGPATPVEVTGFSDVPQAGDLFQVVDEEAKARSIAEFRQLEVRKRGLAPAMGKATLEQLFERIQQGELKELAVVLKADVQGSVEVLTETLRKLSTEQVKIDIIHSGVGAITTNDVILASASNAVVVGFNVRPERKATDLADKEEVDIRLHTVIYELTDELRRAMTGLLEPTFKEVTRGRAEVRDTFSLPKLGVVAGCHVVEGVIPRNAGARLLRDNVVIYEGKVASLRRFKEDVSEVRAGFDCGIRLDKYQDVKPGDNIEAFIQEEVAPSL
ncbi:MAG: translation initiation factor IF-2 [Thermoanaerobaculia bacterium]